MTSARSDRYWTGIKFLVGLTIVSFLLYVIAYLIRAPPANAEVSFDTYPLVSTFVYAFSVTVVFGQIPFCYLVSRDKRELAKTHPDVNQRHPITIGIFMYFTFGLYSLLYLIQRYRKAGGRLTVSGAFDSLGWGGTNQQTGDKSQQSTNDTEVYQPQGDTTDTQVYSPQGDTTDTQVYSPQGDTTDTQVYSPQTNMGEQAPEANAFVSGDDDVSTDESE